MKSIITILVSLVFGAVCHNAFALGQQQFVTESNSAGSFKLFGNGKAATIFVDANDWPGVVRAATDLQADVQRVSKVAPTLTHSEKELSAGDIIVGTVGKSAVIDRLIREKKMDVADISGKWEATFVQVVKQPLPGVESALVIAGSDKRGTIFGIYDLSEQMGVSPWHWFADVPPKQHESLFVNAVALCKARLR
jgi:hypothetical protein